MVKIFLICQTARQSLLFSGRMIMIPSTPASPPLQVVMAPHEQAEEFISSYRKLMQEDIDVNNFQKILEMKVRLSSPAGM